MSGRTADIAESTSELVLPGPEVAPLEKYCFRADSEFGSVGAKIERQVGVVEIHSLGSVETRENDIQEIALLGGREAPPEAHHFVNELCSMKKAAIPRTSRST
jgi:hypothetical protein